MIIIATTNEIIISKHVTVYTKCQIQNKYTWRCWIHNYVTIFQLNTLLRRNQKVTYVRTQNCPNDVMSEWWLCKMHAWIHEIYEALPIVVLIESGVKCIAAITLPVRWKTGDNRTQLKERIKVNNYYLVSILFNTNVNTIWRLVLYIMSKIYF